MKADTQKSGIARIDCLKNKRKSVSFRPDVESTDVSLLSPSLQETKDSARVFAELETSAFSDVLEPSQGVRQPQDGWRQNV